MNARWLCLISAVWGFGCQSSMPVRPSMLDEESLKKADSKGEGAFSVAELEPTALALNKNDFDLAAQEIAKLQVAYPRNDLVRGFDFEIARERHRQHFFSSLDSQHDLLLRATAALTSSVRSVKEGTVLTERLSAALGGLGVSLPYSWGWFDKTDSEPERTTNAIGDLTLTLRHIPFASGDSAWTAGVDFVVATGAVRFAEGERILRGFYRYGRILGDFSVSAGLGISLNASGFNDGLDAVYIEPLVEGTWRANRFFGLHTGYSGAFDVTDSFSERGNHFAFGFRYFPAGFGVSESESPLSALRNFTLGLMGRVSLRETNAWWLASLELRYTY